MKLSFIIKFAKLVIYKRGSRGSLNLSKIRSKNKQVCENAVTRLYGSCMLRVMGSWLDPFITGPASRFGPPQGANQRVSFYGEPVHNYVLLFVFRVQQAHLAELEILVTLVNR